MAKTTMFIITATTVIAINGILSEVLNNTAKRIIATTNTKRLNAK